MERIIRSAGDVAAVRTRAERHDVRSIRVDLATGNSRLRPLVKRINGNLRACGCVSGAIGCVVSLATLPWVTAVLQARGAQSWGALATLVLAYTCTAPLIGKVAGLLAAQVRLMHNLRDLHA